MELTWLDPDHLDDRDVAGAVAVLEAARLADYPHQLGPTVSWFTARLRHGWDGDPPTAGLARDGRGRVVGVVEVSLPEWDNTHTGWVDVSPTINEKASRELPRSSEFRSPSLPRLRS